MTSAPTLRKLCLEKSDLSYLRTHAYMVSVLRTLLQSGFVLLYTKSVLAEQTTPHAGVLNDTLLGCIVLSRNPTIPSPSLPQSPWLFNAPGAAKRHAKDRTCLKLSPRPTSF